MYAKQCKILCLCFYDIIMSPKKSSIVCQSAGKHTINAASIRYAYLLSKQETAFSKKQANAAPLLGKRMFQVCQYFRILTGQK